MRPPVDRSANNVTDWCKQVDITYPIPTLQLILMCKKRSNFDTHILENLATLSVFRALPLPSLKNLGYTIDGCFYYFQFISII